MYGIVNINRVHTGGSAELLRKTPKDLYPSEFCYSIGNAESFASEILS